jgi:hypothetical protein
VQVMPPLLDNCGYWGLGDILGPIGVPADIDWLLGMPYTAHACTCNAISAAYLQCTCMTITLLPTAGL